MSIAYTVIRRLVLGLSAIRLIPAGCLMAMSPQRSLIFSDQDRWARMHHRNVPKTVWQRAMVFIEMMTFRREYRVILLNRLGLAGKLVSILSPRPSTITLTCDDIGEGFCLQHGMVSNISAERIGRNCTIYQLVTLGYSEDDVRPTVGNDVTIYPGATVVGRVHLGDGCTVGANSLVVADVPAGTTVLGVPARPVSWGTKPAREVALAS